MDEHNGKPLKDSLQVPAIQHVQKHGISISLDDIHTKTEEDDKTKKEGKLDKHPQFVNAKSEQSMVSYAESTDSEDENVNNAVTLMYARHEKLPVKDFSAEVRALMDVESFLKSAVLLLDITETNQTDILECMLKKLLDTDDTQKLDAAKKALFTHDRVHLPGRIIQGTSISYGGGVDYDQSWICLLGSLPFIQKRQVAIARLKHPVNLGRTSQETQLIILVIVPTKEKGTKNATETGRTFSTLFSDIDLRQRLLECPSEEEFKNTIWEYTKALVTRQATNPRTARRISVVDLAAIVIPNRKDKLCPVGYGLFHDVKGRLQHYISDYKDGVFGHRTPYKVISTVFFLYFACLLPCIALGQLNYKNTDGAIDVRKVLFSQVIGGVFFALVGGQPLIILLTTAPLALYTKVIFQICQDFDIEFLPMFSCVGLWNSFFLIVYSLLGASKLMIWSTRSTEEIFGIFISVAFVVDVCKDIAKNFGHYYADPVCYASSAAVNSSQAINVSALTSNNVSSVVDDVCKRENSLLFLILLCGTFWLGVTLYNFTKTPFLNANKREVLADYSLPVAVLAMSFLGSYIFRDIQLDSFYLGKGVSFKITPIWNLTWGVILASMGLGFSLSLLFFMDQNISSAVVNNPQNRLKKGSAYHWDLFVVAIINAVLSIFGLPWIHAALPHSPLHVKALADMEERVDQGHVYQIVVRVRETRLTGIIANTLIGLSILMIPIPLTYIPTAVLDGVFLIIAVTALYDIQMYERLLLLFTEQNAYPPNHYIRRVPQRKVHLFTFTQLIQLGILCCFGFSPISYMKMVFPILIMLLLPMRHLLIPQVIEKKYLTALDGHM
ncbi:solute carrier family 4 member 11-like isoform X2 [Tubulanus polymorphus]|uniref:solute carrier family 4 member 11-like isoform X2 n=1 Tax=Tubulanus polymorphus TaxID=672921 RepID=UPI003DA591A4